jgi:hypothetical protein
MCGVVPGRQACAVELLTVTKMSIAISTSRSGTATRARMRAIRRAPCRLVPGGSDSVRGAPSFLVSLVKIENIDASRGSLFRPRCCPGYVRPYDQPQEATAAI